MSKLWGTNLFLIVVLWIEKEEDDFIFSTDLAEWFVRKLDR